MGVVVLAGGFRGAGQLRRAWNGTKKAAAQENLIFAIKCRLEEDALLLMMMMMR